MRITNRFWSTLLRLTVVGVIAATSALPQGASAVQIRSAVTPSWVSDLTAIPGTDTIELHFRAPTESGDTPILGYGYSLDDGANWNFMPTSTMADGTIVGTIRGLTPNTGYSIQVAAWNAGGRGISSGTTSGTRAAAAPVPAAPTNLQWGNQGDLVVITYTPPSGSVTGSMAQIFSNGVWVDYPQTSGNSTSVALSGLTVGTYYDVRVACMNASGVGAWSATLHVLKASVPAAVRNVEVTYTPYGASASVKFSAPASNGGEALQAYEGAWRRVGTSTWNWSVRIEAAATTMTITPRDTLSVYEFAVRATNNVGAGPIVSAPTLTGTVSDAGVNLSWTKPEADAPIVGYTLQYRLVGATAWVEKSVTEQSYLLSGLIGGTQYQLRVAGRTASGVASYSPIITSMATSVPGAPRLLTASLNAAKQLVLKWQAPDVLGGTALRSYQLSTDGTTWSDVTSSTSGNDITSIYASALTASTTFRVAAVNSSGRGASATIVVAPQTLTLDKPADVSVSDKTFALKDVTSAGLPLTYTATPESICTVSQSTLKLVAAGSCTVTAMQAGTATATSVTLPAQVSTVFTIDGPRIYPPSAPTGLQVRKTVGDAQTFTLTWTAPTSNGGSPVTSYSVQYRRGTQWFIIFGAGNSAATTATVKVTTGAANAFRVAATNAKGSSAYSEEAAPVAAKPSAPTNVKIASASGVAYTFTISWTAPSSDGGEALTYTLQDFKSGSWSDFVWDGLQSGGVVTGLTPDGNKVTIRVCAGNSGGVTCSTEAIYDSTPKATPTPSPTKASTAIASVTVSVDSKFAISATSRTALTAFAKAVKAAGKSVTAKIVAKTTANGATILANIRTALKAAGFTGTVTSTPKVGRPVSIVVSAS